MSENSRPRRFLPLILTVLALIAGCATVDGTTPAAVGTTPKEDPNAGIEQWKCGDYFDGCGFLATNCVTLTASLHDGTGEVKFGDIVEPTLFHVQGIERRWDWCLSAAYECGDLWMARAITISEVRTTEGQSRRTLAQSAECGPECPSQDVNVACAVPISHQSRSRIVDAVPTPEVLLPRHRCLVRDPGSPERHRLRAELLQFPRFGRRKGKADGPIQVRTSAECGLKHECPSKRKRSGCQRSRLRCSNFAPSGADLGPFFNCRRFLV